MHPPKIEELAGSLVPGVGAVSLRCLGTGLFNTTYRAVRDGVAYALRVPSAGAPPWAERAWEIRVLEEAGRAGLAPPLLYADAHNGVLLLGWVAGDIWSATEARSPEAIEKLTRLLRAVHALPIPEPASRIDALAWVERYSRALRPSPSSAAAQLAGAAARATRSLKAMSQRILPVVCHSDLHRLNVLQRQGATPEHELLLLDWEYAHVADGYWDLAGWSANNDLPREAERALLASYGAAPASESQWQRFRLQYWLFDYICLLWIELYVRLQPADSSLIAARAAWLERRLRSSVYGTITGC